MTMLNGTFPMNPGFGPESTVDIYNICWGAKDFRETMPGSIHSTSTDAGNTPTTKLRAGLLLAWHAASTYAGYFKPWSPTSTVAGGNRIAAVLFHDTDTTPLGQSAISHFQGNLLLRGRLKSSMLVVPGAADRSIIGNAYEYVIRRQLKNLGFFLDDSAKYPIGQDMGGLVMAKTADYTVTVYDNGTHFTNTGASGAVIFTLPATPAHGLEYTFSATAAQTITITAGTADTLIGFNDAVATSIALSTSGEKIGGSFIVRGDGTKWIAMPLIHGLGATAQTVTTTA